MDRLKRKLILIYICTGAGILTLTQAAIVLDGFLLFEVIRLLQPMDLLQGLKTGGGQLLTVSFWVVLLIFLYYASTMIPFLGDTILTLGAAQIQTKLSELTTQVTALGVIQKLASEDTHHAGILIFLIRVIPYIPVLVGALLYVFFISKEIERYRETAERENGEYLKRRNTLISGIVHDFKTPLTGIIGYADALRDGIIQDEQKRQEVILKIRDKAGELNDLSQLLLDFTKIENDAMNLSFEQVSMSELVILAVEKQRNLISNAGMSVKLRLPEEEVFLTCDRVQMGRVLQNLLVNAVRHNPPGTQILVELQQREEETEIIVADSGVEIPEADAAHMFEAFFMGDESRKKEGNGLGLSIARKIMELHRGGLLYYTGGPDEYSRPTLSGYTKAFILYLPNAQEACRISGEK